MSSLDSEELIQKIKARIKELSKYDNDTENGYIAYHTYGNYQAYKYDNILFIGITLRMTFSQAKIIAYELNYEITLKEHKCLQHNNTF